MTHLKGLDGDIIRKVTDFWNAPISWKNVNIKWQGKWHSLNEPVKILTLSRHVSDIIRYVALFYVIHVIHRLLKYVSSKW